MTPIRILGLAVFLFFVSCQKEISTDSTGDPSSPLNGSLRMKIDGKGWAADKGVGAFVMNDLLHLSGYSADKKYFHFTLSDDVPGTYILNQSSLSAAALTDSNSTTTYAFATNQGEDEQFAGGVVVVTSVDQRNKTVSGTFQFKMFREYDSAQIVITDGVFAKVSYLTSL